MNQKKEENIIGVVMCGGNSSRMGRDKGLINVNGSTWAQLAFEKLKSYTDEVYVSINSTQRENYKKIFSGDLMIEDNITLKGPLAGLFSVHKVFPFKDKFLLACDMLKIDDSTISRLINIYKTNKSLYEFFVYKKNVNFETLAGIYTAPGTEKAFNSYLRGSLKKGSLNYILEKGITYAVKIREREKFYNYNYPEDISGGKENKPVQN
jgi:molybdopterin-guanine dinucleotide biosynthesis protein A